jgi:thiol-disulfide isomerase/thioredoxin
LIGLPVVFALASAPLPPVGPDKAFATIGSADARQRRLQVAPSEAKPNFSLSDLEGSQHELKRQAGRVVLVHFFATWCEPCREELSSLSRLAERPGSQPPSVLAVNVAEVPARVRRFLESAPVNFPVLLDANRAVTRAWGVSVLPTTFVLDRELAARLFVEGDLDWMGADVLAAIEQVGAVKGK